MSRYSEITETEQKLRSSMTYHNWVERNRGPACLSCDSPDNLQVHHIVELYHIMLGLWKLYGDIDMVYAHAQAIHIDDNCEAVTLCNDCHQKLHPGRRINFSTDGIRIENWCAIPRKMPAPFIHHPSKADEHGLTLVAAQILCAIGWFILEGRLESRMLEFKRSTLAKLIGKSQGTSFNESLNRSLDTLESLGILLAWHIEGPAVELHLSEAYLHKLDSNPWFMSISDVKTGSMPVFALRWFLGLQSKRTDYKIGKDKLVNNLCLTTSTPAFVIRCVERACNQIDWATFTGYDGEFMSFKLKRRGAVPIWSLRTVLKDAIREGI